MVLGQKRRHHFHCEFPAPKFQDLGKRMHAKTSKNYPGKRLQTVWGVGSQCFRCKQLYVQDLIPENLRPGHRRELHLERQKMTFYTEDLLRPSHARRTSIQTPLIQSIFKILMQGPFREDCARISTRSSQKEWCKIMQGPLR